MPLIRTVRDVLQLLPPRLFSIEWSYCQQCIQRLVKHGNGLMTGNATGQERVDLDFQGAQ